MRVNAGLLFLCAVCQIGQAASDPAAEALEGAWLVSVGDEPRERFLIVSGAQTERGQVNVASARYGWLDHKGRKAGDWQADVVGDTIRLSFRTGADSLVNVTFKSQESSVSGTLTTKAGKTLPVRMTRLPQEELDALRAAAKGAKAPRPALSSGAQVSLLYVGADNCPPCRRFISTYGSDGQGLKNIAPELADVRFVKVQLYFFTTPIFATQLPEDLRWVLDPGPRGEPAVRKFGTPFFALIAERRVLAQGHGVTALETLIVPALREAAAGRRAN